MAVNVFTALHKFGPEAEENYLTESFVLLLELLLERSPDFGLSVINQLCGYSVQDGFKDSKSICLSTQETVDKGRPDITISDGDIKLVYVEVKHDAPLSQGQLEYYFEKLGESDINDTRLVLLTRSFESARETTLPPNHYHHVCWYEIYNWLDNSGVDEKVSNYFLRQFMEFLEEKRMSMNKVSWEYIQGVPALVHLSDMLEIAIIEALPETNIKKTSGWSWRGFFLDEIYYVGIRFREPLLVVFEDNIGTNPTYKCDLDLEKVHFFSLTKDEQFESLIEFLRETYLNASQGDKN